MPECRKCFQIKNEDEFSFANKKLGKRIKQCKTCIAQATSAHYKSNKNNYLNSSQKFRERVRVELRAIKEKHPCADCGQKYPYYVMDFDHRDKLQKTADVSKLLRIKGSVAVFDEIKKCDIVCANCHRIRTHQRQDHLENKK